MPRDVATRWNSTYDMIAFAVRYRVVINAMYHDRALGSYELNNLEWNMLTDLKAILKVCRCSLSE
jgi:hypothetical protein